MHYVPSAAPAGATLIVYVSSQLAGLPYVPGGPANYIAPYSFTISLTDAPTVASPVPDFAYSVGGAGRVDFVVHSVDPGGLPISHTWDFGDGRTGSGTSPTHVYTVPGSYRVTLTARNSAGRSASVTKTVVVAPSALVVNSTADAIATTPAAGCATGGTVGSPPVSECTLRAAIQTLDAGVGSTITFALPADSTTIAPGSELPKITAAGATIDGTSQPSGMPTISGAGLAVDGAAHATIKGLSIVAAPAAAVDF